MRVLSLTGKLEDSESKVAEARSLLEEGRARCPCLDG